MREYQTVTISIEVAGSVMSVSGCTACPLYDAEWGNCQARGADNGESVAGVKYLEDEHYRTIGETLPSECPLRSGPVKVWVEGEIPPCQEDDR